MRRTSAMLAASLLTGCYAGRAPVIADGSREPTGSSTSASGPTSTGAASPDPASSDSGQTSGPAQTSPATDASSGDGPAAAPGVHWVGRFDGQLPDPVRVSWSGSGLVVRFDGTGVTVTLDDPARYFTVVVDGVVGPPLATSPGVRDYPLAIGLPPEEHVVELYRRTEAHFGPTVVHAVTVDGELLAPPAVSRRMEVVGDSISAGYGSAGRAPCRFSPETEDHYITYGATAARQVGAELHTVAWSGKGVVYNYGDDVTEPLPEIYDRTIATEDGRWGFGWSPDVVVINLGTNDFSTDGDPSREVFVGAYVDFLVHLRDVHPDAFLLVVAPSLFGDEARRVEGYLEDVVARRRADDDAAVAYTNINVEWIGSGCDGHPSAATHAGMAERLVQALEQHLGW